MQAEKRMERKREIERVRKNEERVRRRQSEKKTEREKDEDVRDVMEKRKEGGLDESKDDSKRHLKR